MTTQYSSWTNGVFKSTHLYVYSLNFLTHQFTGDTKSTFCAEIGESEKCILYEMLLIKGFLGRYKRFLVDYESGEILKFNMATSNG